MRFAFRRQQDCMKRNQTPRAPWLLKLLQNDLIIIFLVVAPTYHYCNTFTLCFSGELSWLSYLPMGYDTKASYI